MLVVRIKPRAVREIHQAAGWWSLNRPSAPGAIEFDVVAALAALVEQAGNRAQGRERPRRGDSPRLPREGRLLFCTTGPRAGSWTSLRSGIRLGSESLAFDSLGDLGVRPKF